MSTSVYPHLDQTFMRRLFWGRTFGLAIKEVRETAGFSIEEAARRAGMEVREWKAIERGYPPDLGHMDRIAAALEVDNKVVANLVTFCTGAWDE